MTFEEYAKDYLAWSLSVHRSQRTALSEVRRLVVLLGHPLDEITSAQVRTGHASGGGRGGRGSPARRSDVARPSIYLRFPSRGGWGRLANGPRVGRVADPEHGPAVRAPVPGPLGSSRREDRSGSLHRRLGARKCWRTSARLRLCRDGHSRRRSETLGKYLTEMTRRGGRARLKASDSKSDRGASPSGVQILSPPPLFLILDMAKPC